MDAMFFGFAVNFSVVSIDRDCGAVHKISFATSRNVNLAIGIYA